MAAKQEKTKTVAVKRAVKPRATSKQAKTAEITEAMIAERAYFLSLAGEGANDVENWVRAESELRLSL